MREATHYVGSQPYQWIPNHDSYHAGQRHHEDGDCEIHLTSKYVSRVRPKRDNLWIDILERHRNAVRGRPSSVVPLIILKVASFNTPNVSIHTKYSKGLSVQEDVGRIQGSLWINEIQVLNDLPLCSSRQRRCRRNGGIWCGKRG